MKVEMAKNEDLNTVLSIFASAKKYMSGENNFQWGDNYPNLAILNDDLKNNNLYIIKDSHEIVAVFAFILGPEHTYKKIDGEWLNSKPYGTIHRLAKISSAKGIFKLVINFCFTKIDNIRIDTKSTNLSMLNKLEQFNFHRCGIILLDNKEERVAFQKERDENVLP